MTLQERIDRYMSETRSQRVGGWTAAPPLIRLLWLLRLDVPPPLYWRPWVVALVDGVLFGIAFVLVLVFLFGEPWQRTRTAWIAAVAFGLGTAAFSYRLSRRLRLSPWSGHSVADA